MKASFWKHGIYVQASPNKADSRLVERVTKLLVESHGFDYGELVDDGREYGLTLIRLDTIAANREAYESAKFHAKQVSIG